MKLTKHLAQFILPEKLVGVLVARIEDSEVVHK
jgi:hypothetical protein